MRLSQILPCLLVPLLIACGGKDDSDTDIVVPTTTTTTTTTDTSGGTEMVEVGTTSWVVRGMTVFSGPLDESTPSCVLGSKHAFSLEVFGPGDAHLGPYDNEVLDGATACGFHVGTSFTSDEFSAGEGIWMGMVLVPDSGNVAGNSPDFDSGDVINWDRFPMLIDGDLRRGPFTIVDTNLDGFFPPPEDFGFSVNGHSHAVLFFGTAVENMPAGATPPGEYEYHVALRDATSDITDAGWDVLTKFVIADPE